MSQKQTIYIDPLIPLPGFAPPIDNSSKEGVFQPGVLFGLSKMQGSQSDQKSLPCINFKGTVTAA